MAVLDMFEVSPPGRDVSRITESNLIFGVVAFIWAEYLWELLLKVRQLRVYQAETKVPSDVKEFLPNDAFQRSRAYNIEKSGFTLVKDFVVVLLKTSVVLSRSHARMWALSSNLLSSSDVMTTDYGEIVCSCLAVGISNIINTITFLPFKMFETFILNRRHGMTDQTYAGFFREQIKLAIVTVLLLEPMVAGIVYIVKTSGPNFYIHLWLYTLVMVFIYVTIYPEFIAPLCETLVPLPEGELQSRIRNLASDLDMKSPVVYVIEGDGFSERENLRPRRPYNQLALSGPIRARIDIDCNIMKGYKNASGTIDVGEKGLNNDMLVALTAHEFAHRKLNHLLKKTAVIQGSLLLEFFIFSHMYSYPLIYSAFGFKNQPIIMGFLITMEILLAPYNVVATVLLAAMNRKFEIEADQYARDLGHGIFLRKAILTLARDNCIFPDGDPLYTKWFEKCPPIRSRLSVLQ